MFNIIITTFLLLLIIGTILIIIFDNGDSGRKIAWMLIIAVIPAFGLLLYLIVGINPRQSWFFKDKHDRFVKFFNEHTEDWVKDILFGKSKEADLKKPFSPLARLLSNGSSTTVNDNNKVEIITSGQRKFHLLMQDLENAKDFIHMEYFYFRKDEGSKQIKEMLMKKAKEGVVVRFIHENIANIVIAPGYYNEMKKAGVLVQKFTKPRWPLINLFTQLNYRDHRKIVVIDGKIGYTGGMNISDNYFLRWRDTHLRLTGNAVAGLQYSFLSSWITSGGQVDDNLNTYFYNFDLNKEKKEALESKADKEKEEEQIFNDLQKAPADNLDINFKLPGINKLIQIVPDEPYSKWPKIQMGAAWAIQTAKKYVYIQTPYFVPPEQILLSLQSAALSGVDVRIMVPRHADLFFMGPANRSYFTECLEAGIKIYERKGRFIHSKTIVSDDYLSEIGSANMDFRSFHLDYELNAYIYDESTAKLNKAIFLKDVEASEEVTLEKWKNRPLHKKFLQKIIRLFAPLL